MTTTGADSSGSPGSGPAGDSDAGNTGPPCSSDLMFDADMFPDAVRGEAYEMSVGFTSPAGWLIALSMDEVPPGLDVQVGEDSMRLFGTPTQAGEFMLQLGLYNDDGATCGSGQVLVIRVAPGAGATGGSTGGGSSTG